MLEHLIEIILAAFATFRVAEMISIDEGALSVFLKFRIAVGVYDIGENGEPRTNAARLVNCPYCVGVWIAFIMALCIDLTQTFLLTWLAICGMQAFVQTIGGRK